MVRLTCYGCLIWFFVGGTLFTPADPKEPKFWTTPLRLTITGECTWSRQFARDWDRLSVVLDDWRWPCSITCWNLKFREV
jgi:hypothetical protein